MLDSCDRGTAVGQRDYAILLLLARLGLRAGEVVALTLDDFNWDEGIVTVPGKGKRHEPLPLPRESGEALTEYLRTSRPACPTGDCSSACGRRIGASAPRHPSAMSCGER